MKTSTKAFYTEVLLILIYLGFQFLFLTKLPDVMEDEPWYASTAYNLSQGDWFSNTNVGSSGGDSFIIFTIIQGLLIKVFGCSLFVSRFVSVLAGFFALWGLLSILKKLKVSLITTVLVSLFFIFSNVTYIVFRSGRPEGWILAFGIWSVYYLVSYHDSKNLRYIFYVVVLSSLSFLTHPNGLLFMLNAGIYLLIHAIKDKKFAHLLYFGFGSLFILVLYFVIVFIRPDSPLGILTEQLSWRTNVSGTNYTVLDNVRNFFNNYTLGIKRLYILLFETGILVFGIIISKKGSLLRYFSLFGVINLLFSLIFFSYYSTRHFGEIIVFALLVFALIIEQIREKKFRLAIIATGLIYFLNNLAGDAYLINNKMRNTSYSEIESRISELVPDNSTVITSLHFWYPLKNTQFYSEYCDWEIKPYKNLDELLQSNSVDFVILTNELLAGKTGTSGRQEELPENLEELYYKSLDYAKSNGELIEAIPAIGYDTLKVYKIKKSDPGILNTK